MLIRAACTDDVDALVALYAEWGHPQPADVIAERLTAWNATPYAEILIAELDGSVVAGVAAVSAALHLARPGRLARLAGLVVGQASRRRGVGVALLRASEQLARGWGCDRMEITSSRSRTEAGEFYPALGYQDQSDRQARYIRPL